jgi:hypothetical protein
METMPLCPCVKVQGEKHGFLVPPTQRVIPWGPGTVHFCLVGVFLASREIPMWAFWHGNTSLAVLPAKKLETL